MDSDLIEIKNNLTILLRMLDLDFHQTGVGIVNKLTQQRRERKGKHIPLDLPPQQAYSFLFHLLRLLF